MGTIVDDDPLPSLTINDVSLTEGDAGTANMTFTATLSAASAKTVTVDYGTADGTATAPADYGLSVGTLTFNPGVVTRTFTVPVVGDTTDEFDETFLANLSNPANATIADNQGVGTIVDNDAAPTVSIDNVSTAEGDAGTTTATFTVSLSAASGKPITVDYASADGTAAAPGRLHGRVGHPVVRARSGVEDRRRRPPGRRPGRVQRDVHRPALEPHERGARIRHRHRDIVDDDPTATVSIGGASVAEGDSGTTTVSLTVSLSAASGKPITVDYTSADGTAVAPGDYAGVSGTLSFAPGQTSKTVDVDIAGDTTYENDETLTVALSNPVNVVLGSTPATVTVTNDDPMPQVSIDDRSVTEGDAGTTTATFTVSLSNPSAFPITVDASTSDQTATAPADYGAVSTTVSFAPGQVSKTVDVLVRGDTLDEFDETYSVDLSNPSGASIADGTGIGTIVDDDAAPTVTHRRRFDA